MGEPTYKSDTPESSQIQTIDSNNKSENIGDSDFLDFRNALLLRLPGSRLASGVSLQTEIILGAGAPDAEFDSASIGAKYLNTTTGRWYTKYAASGSYWAIDKITVSAELGEAPTYETYYAGDFVVDTSSDDVYVCKKDLTNSWAKIHA